MVAYTETRRLAFGTGGVVSTGQKPLEVCVCWVGGRGDIPSAGEVISQALPARHMQFP